MPNDYSNKEIALQQDSFIQSLEGIGDILVFQARKQKNKQVLEGLQRIKKIIDQFLHIKETDPDRFERLLLSQEFFEIYDKNKREAQFRLAFSPGRYLVAFTTCINQILRVYETAVEYRNSEISRSATANIIFILEDLVSSKDNEILVNQLLKSIYDIRSMAIEKSDSSVYLATADWYTHSLFSITGPEKKDKFDLYFLNIFNDHLFFAAKQLINENKPVLFERLVGSLVDGIHIPEYNDSSIMEYGFLLSEQDFSSYKKLDDDYQLSKKITKLESRQNLLFSEKDLEEWKSDFTEISKVLNPYFNDTFKKKARELTKKIMQYVNIKYKHNALYMTIFRIMAFCLLKRTPDYFRVILEYKQPLDTDTSWVGHNIVPNTLKELIDLFYGNDLLFHGKELGEGHRGSKLYYQETFLLIAAYIIKRTHTDPSSNEHFNFEKLSVYTPSNIQYSVEELKSVLNKLVEDRELVLGLEFRSEEVQDILNKAVGIFLDTLKKKAEERLDFLERTLPPSPKKIAKYKSDFILEFNKSGLLRGALKHFGLIEDKKDIVIDDTTRFGLSTLYPKAAFFEDWHVHYGNDGKEAGRDFAFQESSKLLRDIVQHCTVSEKIFLDLINSLKITDKFAIFVSVHNMYDYFHDLPNFKPAWAQNVKKLDIEWFKGWYKIGDMEIPVFEHHLKDQEILILNMEKLGKLVQYSPINKDSNNIPDDIFDLSIKAFSDHEDLIEQFLKKPPDWLKNYEQESEKREYLLKHVLLEIWEKFGLDFDKNFEGYITKAKRPEAKKELSSDNA